MKKLSKSLLVLAFLFGCTASLCAQGITTASAYFKSISDYYATFKDYEVDFNIKINTKETIGVLSYKSPNYVRLDYTKPANQVICFNGEVLTMYLPESAAVLQQSAKTSTSMAPQGLSLMSRYYSVAYETGQSAVPLDSYSDEMVVKFILKRKSGAEAFTYIKVAVNPETKLIRRMEAVTPSGITFTINFLGYRINQGMSENRFIYDAPSSANNLNNFLYAE